MKILSAEQMRNIDRRATERFGIPSIVLMENAALAVVDAIADHYPEIDRAAIFCGTGANGGDGLAIARHLENRGVVPVVFLLGDRARFKGDAKTNFDICERLGIPMYDVHDDVESALAHAADADLVIDAIFGTGLDRAPAGKYAEVIQAIAELRLPVVAVDLPSGLNASSPEPFEPCIQAEVTVTFAAPKLCHVFDPAAAYCGEVIVADISIPEAALEDENVQLAVTATRDVAPLFASRAASTHKGTYGHVAIVAGSEGRSGAAALAACGATRTGAGLVTVVTDRRTAKLVHNHSAESMTYSGEDVAAFVNGKSAALIGPGLADNESSYESIRELVANIEVPLVIDASALNAFAGNIGAVGKGRILTPHPGELARLIGRDTKWINANRIEAARNAARDASSIVVLKGHQTLVADPDGYVNVNPTGNPGMASGGMGDVLGGIIAALLARGVDAFEAAVAGVYLHGFAGDLLAEELGDAGLTAMDLAERLPVAMKRL